MTSEDREMTQAVKESPAALQPPLDDAAIKAFIAHEADLLDEQRFEEWCDLFAEDGIYWVPAQHGQEDPKTHVSLFYDDKPILRTRVRRLLDPMIHCQDPPSACIRVLSEPAVKADPARAGEYQVRSKFVMVEDRIGGERRIYAGRCFHTLRATNEGLRIVLKRVNLTNCDHSFPMLAQPL
jgi:3-phenylpropionate/cinnamic acid dioxygenase small subunit